MNETTDFLLRETLQQIKEGHKAFKSGAGKGDRARFQMVIESLLFAGERGYISEPKLHKSSRSGVNEYDRAVVEGGLTIEGQRWLQESSSRSTDLPVFDPGVEPTTFETRVFVNFQYGDFPTEASVQELVELLYNEPDWSVYYFFPTDGGPDSFIAQSCGSILMNKMERRYYKRPNSKNDFLHIEQREEYYWDWQREVVEKGPEYWRAPLQLASRKKQELEIAHKLYLEEQYREQEREKAEAVLAEDIENLRADFAVFKAETNRQAAGLQLEPLLNSLFRLFGLDPRKPFRIVGEQIDGSFALDNEVYLLEAKWEKDPLPEDPLLKFRGVIEGKSSFTRGVLIAINGISDQAKDAITRGKQPNFFVLDGEHLMKVLTKEVALPELLLQAQRILAEEGLVYVPYLELSKGSRSRS